MSGRRLRALGPLLVPVAVALFVFRGLLFLGELPFRRDMGRLFVPLKRVLSESLRAGTLPEWWPWDGLGMPFIAVPVISTFHPSTVFFTVLPFHAAFVLQMLVPVPTALLGTWRLGRALGLRPVFAALAATAYTLGPYFLGVTEFTATSLAAAALPWLWWGALRCRTGGRLRPVVLALSLAWMLLAGDPHLSIMGLMGAAVLMVRPTRPRQWVRPARSLALGTVLAVALSAVQLVPSLMLFRESPRSSGAGIVSPDYWRFDLHQLSGMVDPGALAGRDVMFEMTYLGLGVVALVLGGSLARGRLRFQLVGIALVSLVLATGSATPLWSLFSAIVPFWKSFQFPVKAIGPVMLALPLLAARGAQQVLRWDRSRFLPGALCALAAGAGTFMGVWGPASWALLLAGALALAAWRRALVPVLSYVALAGVALDLGLANGRLVLTAPVDFYAPPPLAEVLQRNGVSGEGFNYVFLWKPARSHEPGPELDAVQNAALIPLRGALHGLPTANVYLQGFSARYNELVLRNQEQWVGKLAGVFGSRLFIASPSELRPEQREQALGHDERADAMAVPLRRFLPRAYVTGGVTVLPRAQVVDYLGSSRFRPGGEVVLEAEAEGVDASLKHAPTGPARPVERIRREGDVVEVEVTLSSPGMLVLNESYFAGVEASEEGRRLPMYPANHAVRAVPLSKGRHVVRFEYRTPGLLAGSLTSAVAVGVLAATGVLQRRSRRRAQ
ncbi:hypothetical protein [Archangium violaceum]|uniref:YfhO family protein n=1 Tax=Archangium violaceum Cb vi76 TaxID=1406225 RepID=A0A084SV29_9BACT|nr:hypothetical protein [Archangium violaceum]KFA92314.1 hypothetical protein Q664_16040 [Archangium violaceum Cb vi76]